MLLRLLLYYPHQVRRLEAANGRLQREVARLELALRLVRHASASNMAGINLQHMIDLVVPRKDHP